MKMKTTLTVISIVLSSLFLTMCNAKHNEKSPVAAEDTESFDWLLGNWIRLNEEEGKETFENWEKISASEYAGIGFTMQNGDTVKQERIRLVKQDGTWDLIVKVPDETESILFEMAAFDSSSFTVQNDSLDFPKQIKYWKENDNLKALVSGDDLEIPFEFEIKKQ